ncbi:MAG: hypothetical protein AVDCRST_MAG85-3415 [uncultured Solirubrobacteraceae bacterium]|uniref:Uncharacterized protein n=1 Tax=uncultured Solirubrobacteraceae bacterium TaxID=1162706 RepID=A0A6J4TN98_9ACTN|nr:MAG: hypothetical protein AVDCRST_MAG85-3415 [uncultured Solirubrobacteraceae bacterium]
MSAPLKFARGAYVRSVSAVLTSLTVPVSETVPEPLPVTEVRPLEGERVRVPFEALRSTLTSDAPASTSLTDGLSVFAVSSSVVIDAGAVMDGASFTAATVRVRVSVSDFAPPEPVAPASSETTVSVSPPA